MADDNVVDSYTKESTGLIDEYIGVVTKEWFAIAGQGMSPDNTNLNWTVTVEDILEGEAPSNYDGTQSLRFGCGKGYASFDGGDTIEDPNVPDRIDFNQNTGIRSLLKTAAELDMLPALRSRGTAHQANVWHNMKFRFGRKVFSYGGTIGDIPRMWPVEYLGVVSGPVVQAGTQSIPPAPVAVVPEPVVATPVAAEANGVGIDPGMKLKLSAIKVATGSHSEFLDKVIEGLPEVLSDATLAGALSDANGLYATL